MKLTTLVAGAEFSTQVPAPEYQQGGFQSCNTLRKTYLFCYFYCLLGIFFFFFGTGLNVMGSASKKSESRIFFACFEVRAGAELGRHRRRKCKK